MKVLRGADSSLIFFSFFWPPSVLNSSRKPLITEGGKLIVFALYLSFPPCGRASVLKFLLMFPETVLSCLLTRTPGTARRMTDPSRASPWRAGDPGGGGGLEKRIGVPKPAVTNAFQRPADRLANQYNSNGCFCLLYK